MDNGTVRQQAEASGVHGPVRFVYVKLWLRVRGAWRACIDHGMTIGPIVAQRVPRRKCHHEEA
jgi:hypothetical protein